MSISLRIIRRGTYFAGFTAWCVQGIAIQVRIAVELASPVALGKIAGPWSFTPISAQKNGSPLSPA